MRGGLRDTLLDSEAVEPAVTVIDELEENENARVEDCGTPGVRVGVVLADVVGRGVAVIELVLVSVSVTEGKMVLEGETLLVAIARGVTDLVSVVESGTDVVVLATKVGVADTVGTLEGERLEEGFNVAVLEVVEVWPLREAVRLFGGDRLFDTVSDSVRDVEGDCDDVRESLELTVADAVYDLRDAVAEIDPDCVGEFVEAAVDDRV